MLARTRNSVGDKTASRGTKEPNAHSKVSPMSEVEAPLVAVILSSQAAVPIIETIPGDPSAGAVVFDRAPEATAILTMSDWQAITVLDEAVRRGINIPEHVSVVGFDGTAEAARTTPPLSTVAQNIVQKGRLAAAMVFANGPPKQIVMPVELVVRASTARPRG